MSNKIQKITVDDIEVGYDVLQVAGSSDEDILKEAKVKFASFIDDVNKHISELKEDDYELYIIGAGNNVDSLESEIEESLKLINASQALVALEDNKDFRTFIDAYIVDRPKALTNVLTSRRPLPFDVRNLTEQSLSAVGFFQEFMHTISVANADKSMLIQNSISLNLYKKSIQIVNDLILEKNEPLLASKERPNG